MAERILEFIKMNGLGNDFVILDGRDVPISLSEEQLRDISSRDNQQTGGCDQVIVIETAKDADVAMVIYNADGGEVDACGNATRCIGKLIGDELGKDTISINTSAGLLIATVNETDVTVDMGEPGLDWQVIPLSEEMDTINLGIGEGEFKEPVGVSMGNPHAVFFVENADEVDLHDLGPKFEHDPLFPQRANIGAAQVDDRQNITLRVWERGVGETKACGTGACASVVAAVRRNLVERDVTVHLKGGDLQIFWDESTNHVTMTGTVSNAQGGKLKL